jgi:hypothetical protein
MNKIEPLKPEALYRKCDPSRFPFHTTDELESLTEIIGQPRAVEAVRFGIDIRQKAYNLFALGPAGLGRHEILRRFLDEQASTEVPPVDWCYVNNFAQSQKPSPLITHHELYCSCRAVRVFAVR